MNKSIFLLEETSIREQMFLFSSINFFQTNSEHFFALKNTFSFLNFGISSIFDLEKEQYKHIQPFFSFGFMNITTSIQALCLKFNLTYSHQFIEEHLNISSDIINNLFSFNNIYSCQIINQTNLQSVSTVFNSSLKHKLLSLLKMKQKEETFHCSFKYNFLLDFISEGSNLEDTDLSTAKKVLEDFNLLNEQLYLLTKQSQIKHLLFFKGVDYLFALRIFLASQTQNLPKIYFNQNIPLSEIEQSCKFIASYNLSLKHRKPETLNHLLLNLSLLEKKSLLLFKNNISKREKSEKMDKFLAFQLPYTNSNLYSIQKSIQKHFLSL